MIWVIVTGSRDWQSPQAVWMELDRIYSYAGPHMIVVHGDCATGADSDAKDWAKFREVPYLSWPARWNNGHRGNKEGMLRNDQVAHFVFGSVQGVIGGKIECLAFDMKTANGTKQMIDRLEDLDMNIKVFTERGMVYERETGQSNNEARYSELVKQSRISY